MFLMKLRSEIRLVVNRNYLYEILVVNSGSRKCGRRNWGGVVVHLNEGSGKGNCLHRGSVSDPGGGFLCRGL